MESVNPEMTLILRAIQVKPEQGDPPLKNIKWEKLYRLARHHRIFPLLYKRISELKNNPIDSSKLEPFKKHYTVNSLHNIRLARKLLQVLKLFSQNNITAIPFKGPVLAELAHGDLSLRVFNDLDFFIPEGDFFKVYRLLLNEGFSPEFPDSCIMQRFLKRTRRDFLFGKEPLRLDIHQQIIRGPGKFIPGRDWFQNLHPVKILTREVGVFQLENFLVALCMHAARHAWEPLMLIVDIAFLIHRHPRINWERVISSAEQKGCLRILLIGLGLASDICGTRLPETITQNIFRDKRAQRMISIIRKQLLTRDKFVDDMKTFMAIPRTLDSPWLRLKYLCFYMWYPRPIEIAFHKNPEFLLHFWPLIQPFRLLFKRGPQLIKKWFKF